MFEVSKQTNKALFRAASSQIGRLEDIPVSNPKSSTFGNRIVKSHVIRRVNHRVLGNRLNEDKS